MNDSNEQELCVRIVLSEPNAPAIHQAASRVSDPRDEECYGKYEVRERIAEWGNPPAETRKKVLAAFGGVHEPSLLDGSPLLFVKGNRQTFEPLFQGAPLERIDPASPVLQIRSWEWGQALISLEHAVKTVHVSLLRDGAKGRLDPPNRGWLFPHLEQQSGRRALGYRRGNGPASRESARLEDGATPALLRRIYNFPEGFTGKGQ